MVVIELGTFLFLLGNNCTFGAKIYEHTVCLDMGVFPQTSRCLGISPGRGLSSHDVRRLKSHDVRFGTSWLINGGDWNHG